MILFYLWMVNLPLMWQLYLHRVLALEGTRATSMSILASTYRICLRKHILFICMVLITLFKSAFTPLLPDSVGKIRPPSAGSQELFSPEKVSWRKTSSHLAPLRHLWPSLPVMNVHVCCIIAVDRNHVSSIVYHNQSLNRARTQHYICQHKPFSFLLCKWNQ